jgi:hypothetical protein
MIGFDGGNLGQFKGTFSKKMQATMHGIPGNYAIVKISNTVTQVMASMIISAVLSFSDGSITL